MKTKSLILFLISISFILVTVIFLKKTDINKKVINTIELDEVTLRLQWHTQSQFAGYFIALKKGFYRDAGLKVNIKQGGYGKNCLDTVKEGLEEFGTKWMADLTAADTSLFSLANIVKDNGLLLISKKKKDIKNIKDFRGKKISIWFIGNEYQLFTLLDKYKISQNELNIISQKWNMSQFYNNEVDVVSAMIYNEFLHVKKAGYSSKNLNIFNFAKLGMGFPGQNIFTSKSYYKKNPKICLHFIKASIKGWKYAIKHPKEATKIVMSYDKENILKYDHQILQMKEIIKLVQAEKYKIGIHLEKDYKFIEKIFKKYKIIDSKLDITSFYTNNLIKKIK